MVREELDGSDVQEKLPDTTEFEALMRKARGGRPPVVLSDDAYSTPEPYWTHYAPRHGQGIPPHFEWWCDVCKHWCPSMPGGDHTHSEPQAQPCWWCRFWARLTRRTP